MNAAELDASIQMALEAEDEDSQVEIGRRIQQEAPHALLLTACQGLLTGTECERDFATFLLIALSNATSALREQALQLLHQILDHDDSPLVVAGAIMTLAHFTNFESIYKILAHVNDDNAVVRRCTAESLARLASEVDFDLPVPARFAGSEGVTPDLLDSRIVDAMLRLADDPDPDVRDWATFAFTNELSDEDTPAIRTQLRKNLHDSCADARDEAILALALRKDLSVVPVIEQLLSGDSVGEFVLEAVDALNIPHLRAMAAPFRD